MRDYRTLRITDDFMFKKVFSSDPELCREVLEACIGKKLDELVTIEPECTVKITEKGHGVRFDIHAKNGKAIFTAEMQKENQKNLPCRARYDHSVSDSHELAKGASYNELKDSYVIFFCDFDLFREGRACYRFCMTDEEDTSLKLQDGMETIFLNFNRSTYSEETEKHFLDTDSNLDNLLLYFSGETRHNKLVDKVDSALQNAQFNAEWRGEFMTFEEMLQREGEKGRAEGRTEGIKEMILSMIRNTSMTDEEIAVVAKLSVEEIAQLRNERIV